VSRFGVTVESQPAQLAGLPSGLTFNGYFCALVAGASANYKLRRLVIGVRAGAGVPTSQQMTISMQRQTVRIAGTGFTTSTGINLDQRAVATAVTGVDITNAAAAGTTGPTVGTSFKKFTFNTQSAFDLPFEMMEEVVCDQGTANGIALLNIGNALPASHLFVVDWEWEE